MPGLRGPRARGSDSRIRKALALGVRVVAAQFGVDPGTVRRISRPFEDDRARPSPPSRPRDQASQPSFGIRPRYWNALRDSAESAGALRAASATPTAIP